MNAKTRYAMIAAAALLATAAGVFTAEFAKIGQPDSASPIADKAASAAQLQALTLADVNGTDQPLRQWQGKLLVINFWATWCAPCREEMPGFSRLQEKYAAKGAQFVGIAIDSVDKVKEFSASAPVTYPLLIGSPGVMQILAGLGNAAGGLPFTVVFKPDGSLLQAHLGIWQESALESSLLDNLAE